MSYDGRKGWEQSIDRVYDSFEVLSPDPYRNIGNIFLILLQLKINLTYPQLIGEISQIDVVRYLLRSHGL